jgi:hypothetical protein
MKCELCKEKVETTFLNKIKGTYIKKKIVCQNCQKEHGKELKNKI